MTAGTFLRRSATLLLALMAYGSGWTQAAHGQTPYTTTGQGVNVGTVDAGAPRGTGAVLSTAGGRSTVIETPLLSAGSAAVAQAQRAPESGIAFTGADVLVLAGLGMSLVVAGGALLAVRRQRPQS